MRQKTSRLLAITILFAILASTLAPAVTAVATGPFIDITGINAQIEVGTDTGFTLRLYMLDGSDRTGVDLTTLPVSLNLFGLGIGYW